MEFLSNKLKLHVILFLCIVLGAIYIISNSAHITARFDSHLFKTANINPDVQTNIKTDNAKLDIKMISEDERTLAKLVKQSCNSTTALTAAEKSCPMYQEFRRLDFLHPALRHLLCSNAEAYKKYSDGYPICKLRAPFNEDMLNVVRRGSDVVGLLDMQNVKIPMFVYKGNDHISKFIKTSGSWEPQLVHWTLRFALKLPDVTFVDIGSNIGVYSIQAAKLRLPVVSLDANIRNLLRLRLSLDAASLDATLVWNYVASDQNLKHLNFLSNCNVGAAGREKYDLPDTVPVMPFRSERIGQFIKTKNVVMKMDIEGSEAEFLSSSGQMFAEFNVAAVQMEWLRNIIHGNETLLIIKFFTSRDYEVWKLYGFQPLNVADFGNWGQTDVIWIHRSFISMI